MVILESGGGGGGSVRTARETVPEIGGHEGRQRLARVNVDAVARAGVALERLEISVLRAVERNVTIGLALFHIVHQPGTHCARCQNAIHSFSCIVISTFHSLIDMLLISRL